MPAIQQQPPPDLDHSDDGNPELIRVLRAKAACRIELIHRPSGERRRGLRGAVLDGVSVARALLAKAAAPPVDEEGVCAS